MAGLLARTSIANVTAAAAILAAIAYGALTGDTQLVRDLSLIAAGYLFGVTARGGSRGGGQG